MSRKVSAPAEKKIATETELAETVEQSLLLSVLDLMTNKPLPQTPSRQPWIIPGK